MSAIDRITAVVGHGSIHAQLRQRRQAPEHGVVFLDSLDALSGQSAGIVLSVRDGWSHADEMVNQRAARQRGLTYVHAHTDGVLGFVGPAVDARQTGCVWCAELRRRMVTGSPIEQRQLTASAPARAPHAWNDLLVSMLDQVLSDHTTAGRVPDPLRIFVVDGARATAQWHRFTPVGTCPECGEVADDSAAAAMVKPEPRPVAAPGGYRVANTAVSISALRSELCDWRYGVVPRLYRTKGAPMVVSIAELGLSHSATRTAGYGRAPTIDESAFVALLEGLERHAGELPNGKRTSVRGSYDELESALDPRTLGIHDTRYASHPAFRLSPYEPARQMAWVWGYSVTPGRPILVPEQIAYYRRRITDRQNRSDYCFYESSNGCALGNAPEEAALCGLFEVAERDAFLLTWYARLGAPEIPVDDITDPLIQLLTDKIDRAGYDLHLFDITSDLGIPAVWALAVARRPDLPATFSTAGAHLSPARAAAGAITEIAINVVFKTPLPDERRRAVEEMLTAPEKVLTLEDHVDLYTLPESKERFDFLLRPGRPTRRLDEMRPAAALDHPVNDVGETFRRVAGHLSTLGLDVVVVDVTAEEQRPFNLRTAKVIVPGTLPMTFGHVYHRTSGLPRLRQAAIGSGVALEGDRLARVEPHPFP